MFFALSLFPSISVTSTISGIGEWSSPFITEFLPVIYIAGGLAVLAFGVRFVFGKLHDANK